jgi:hypothetical protein
VSRRLLRPGEDSDSPPGQELLGVITSHGPSRESYTSAQKSSGGTAAAPGTAATSAVLSAERMRAALLSAASAPAVLQRAVSKGGAEVGAVESAAEVPDHRWRQAETQWTKPALPGACHKPSEPPAVSEAARVITQEDFFRARVRPAGVLRAVRAPAAESLAALLLRIVPAGAGAGSGAGAALERSAHLIRTY